MLPRRAVLAILGQLVCRAASAQISIPGPRYRGVTVEGMSTVKALQKTHGLAGFEAILHLNRIDLAHVRDGATVIVPETPAPTLDLSPFPGSVGQDAWIPPRLLLVSRRVQAFAAYEQGKLARWGATSTGRRETPTPAGLFATNWRARLRRSTDNASWLLPWYVNFVNSSGVSFHQFALPGYPASHACVRLLMDDAKWIYDWAESWVLADEGRRIDVYGTPVVVFGEYNFDEPGPWTRLSVDSSATDVPLEEVLRAIEPHRELIAERAAARAAFLANEKPARTPPTLQP